MTWQKYILNLRNSLLLEEYFRVMEQFDSTLSSVIDSPLGLRCRLFHFMARFLAMAELKQNRTLNPCDTDVIFGRIQAVLLTLPTKYIFYRQCSTTSVFLPSFFLLLSLPEACAWVTSFLVEPEDTGNMMEVNELT